MSTDLTDDLTDDELGQIRELVRLTGIPFDELADAWRYNRKEKARVDVVSDVLDENHCHGRGKVESSMNSVNPELPYSTTSTPPPVIKKCSHLALHNFKDMKDTTRCRWCGKTVGELKEKTFWEG